MNCGSAILWGIGLGSNLGDSELLLAEARARLVAGALATDLRSSPLYRSTAVDCAPGTADFANAVIIFESDIAPPNLLALALQIEIDLGRPADHGHHTPRTVDIDLLFGGDIILDSEDLTLPHPRAYLRSFVLAPLADLLPDLVLPAQDKTVADLLSDLDSDEPAPVRIQEDW